MSNDTNCCCCFSPKVGTYILGCLAILGVLDEIEMLIWPRLITSLVTSLVFIVMVVNPTAQVRLVFFLVYTVHTLAEMTFGYLEGEAFMEGKLKEHLKQTCAEDKQIPADKKAECEETSFMIVKGMYIIMWILAGGLTYHFLMTIWRYYKQGVEATGRGVELKDEA